MYISCLKGQKKEEGENVLQFNNVIFSFVSLLFINLGEKFVKFFTILKIWKPEGVLIFFRLWWFLTYLKQNFFSMLYTGFTLL